MHRFIIKQYIAMSYKSALFSFLVCFVSILCAWLTVKHLCILVKLTFEDCGCKWLAHHAADPFSRWSSWQQWWLQWMQFRAYNLCRQKVWKLVIASGLCPKCQMALLNAWHYCAGIHFVKNVHKDGCCLFIARAEKKSDLNVLLCVNY